MGAMAKKIGYSGKARAQGREILGADVQPFQVVVATSDAFVWQGAGGGGDIAELVLLANADNIGYVQVAVDAAVGALNYFPLLAGEALGLDGLSLDQLHLKFEKDTDKIHLAFTQVGA